MNADGYEAKSDIEIKEFSRNLTSLVLSLVSRFKPEELIFAMDGPKYWRYRAYDSYYDKHCKMWKEKIDLPPDFKIENNQKVRKEYFETIYYLQYDKKVYSAKWYPELEKFQTTKLKKAERLELNQKIQGGSVGPLGEDDMTEGLRDLIPTYKGNRKTSTWNYDTPRRDFKRLMHSIAAQLGKTFEAKVVMAEEAEADDIAYVYHEMNTPNDVIMVTTDSDWHQLLRKGVFLKFFNPAKWEFVEKTPELASGELAVKIMSGDSSDNIAGISLKGKDATLGKKSAEKLVAKHGAKGIYQFLATDADPDALKRNYQLVYLPNCPKRVQKAIVKGFDVPAQDISDALQIEEYGLDTEDVVDIDMQAGYDRKADIEAGHYES
jgi:5'-3' exonuclease